MYTQREHWELFILNAEHGMAVVADVDGDGVIEVMAADRWFRPATSQRGPIAGGISLRCVGATAGDVDGDGRPEVIGAVRRDTEAAEYYQLYWYKPGDDLSRPWAKHRICGEQIGQPHDLVVADVDGDGRNELVAVRMYIPAPGIYIYKPGQDVAAEWREYVVQRGTSGDGTVVADFDGDGAAEIVAGPYYYRRSPASTLAGPWVQSQIAPGFREMCKAAMLDITGNGKLDVLIAESEYPDCRISWFENRTAEAPDHPWPEHPLDAGYHFVHSIDAWHGPHGEAVVFIAEMEKGGWNAAYNHDARLMTYASADGGATWEGTEIYKGFGTWQALAHDLDGDGGREIVGIGGVTDGCRGIHIWKRRETPSFPVRYRHRFLDRQKPWTGTDILAVDVDGDGRQDVVCAAFWYRNPTWERRQISGVYQVINAYDIDGDGRDELIATVPAPGQPEGRELSSAMVWLKPVDPLHGRWERHYIGTATPGGGSHGWPHGTCVAPILPGGRPALIARGSGPLELYACPDDPREEPWPRRPFPEGEGGDPRMRAVDLTGNGLLDLIAGWKWLENLGDGTFRTHEMVARFDPETCPDGLRGGEHVLADVNGNGLVDVIACEEHTHWDADPRHVSFARVAWLENPGDPRRGPWPMHVIDHVRSPHSLAAADLDGDGQVEIAAGEHDPFRPYRSRCKVYVYKRADPQGESWTRHVVDDRFDHHVGARLIELESGRLGIISHGWREPLYVHLWEPYE